MNCPVQGDAVMIVWPMNGQQELCLQGGCQQWSFQLQKSCNSLSSCPEASLGVLVVRVALLSSAEHEMPLSFW